jgi:hypothetical protein
VRSPTDVARRCHGQQPRLISGNAVPPAGDAFLAMACERSAPNLRHIARLCQRLISTAARKPDDWLRLQRSWRLARFKSTGQRHFAYRGTKHGEAL